MRGSSWSATLVGELTVKRAVLAVNAVSRKLRRSVVQGPMNERHGQQRTKRSRRLLDAQGARNEVPRVAARAQCKKHRRDEVPVR